MSKRGIIRHRETGEYYAGAGRWARAAMEAVYFEDLTEAMVEAEKYGIHNCCEYMVALPENPDLSVSLPI